VGPYYWLIDKQNKAVKWWKRAIKESERLGQRPDLARIYMEIGKRFLEEKIKYKEMSRISAKIIWNRQGRCFKRWTCGGIWMS
jgi:hypothetical protein